MWNQKIERISGVQKCTIPTFCPGGRADRRKKKRAFSITQRRELNILKRRRGSSANKLYAAKQVYLTSWSCSLEPRRLQYGKGLNIRWLLVGYLLQCVWKPSHRDALTYTLWLIIKGREFRNVQMNPLSCSVHLRFTKTGRCWRERSGITFQKWTWLVLAGSPSLSQMSPL